METHQVSAIIVVHDRALLTARAIQALLPDLIRHNGELIVVDQGSSDHSARAAAEAAAGRVPCLVLTSTVNRPWALAANAGARRASGDLLLFIDNDTDIRPGALTALVTGLAGEERAAAIGPKLLQPTGTIEQAGIALPLWLSPLPVGRGATGNDHRFCFPRTAFAVATSCLLVRRSAFENCHGFDEGYCWGFEAADLALSLRKLGLRVLYEPRAECGHEGGATLDATTAQSHSADNRRHFLSRWGGDLLRRVADYMDRLSEDGPKSFLIYGTGDSGMHLANMLELSGYPVLGFLSANGIREVGRYPAWNVRHSPTETRSRVLIGSAMVREAEDELAGAGLLDGAALPILME